jgi:hypothetical protein
MSKVFCNEARITRGLCAALSIDDCRLSIEKAAPPPDLRKASGFPQVGRQSRLGMLPFAGSDAGVAHTENTRRGCLLETSVEE